MGGFTSQKHDTRRFQKGQEEEADKLWQLPDNNDDLKIIDATTTPC